MQAAGSKKNEPNGTGLALKSHGLGSFRRSLRKQTLLWLMIAPAILYFLVFCYLPMGGIVLAFKNFNYQQGIFGSPWVGLKNFDFLFTSGTLWQVTKNTVLYNLAFIAVSLVMEVLVAVMLSELAGKWYKKLAQSLMFLPYFVSYVLLAALIYNLFNFEFGVVNHVLAGFGQEPVDVYGSPAIWKYLLVFFHEWKGLGYGVVIYLAALTGINSEYYEASKIDGANKWQEIAWITIPLLKPTMIIVTLFAVGSIMKGQFELFYQVIGTNSLLYPTTDIIDTYVFRMLTQTFEPGMGTAAGLYQSVLSFVMIVGVNYLVKRVEPDYSLF